MRVISVPARLRLVTFLVLLSVPLVAIEVVLHARAPWWNLPIQSIKAWTLAFTLMSIPLAFWMANGKRWAMQVLAAFAGVWCLFSAWVAIDTKNFWLGLFVIFLCLFWVMIYVWIRHEMNRSFFDPQTDWYQGRPRPIPNVRVQARKENSEDVEKFRVSRIDRDGTFIFVDELDEVQNPRKLLQGLKARQKLRLEFQFRDLAVSCYGVPIRILDESRGVGLKFLGMTADERKNLGDFVELLKGEGYV